MRSQARSFSEGIRPPWQEQTARCFLSSLSLSLDLSRDPSVSSFVRLVELDRLVSLSGPGRRYYFRVDLVTRPSRTFRFFAAVPLVLPVNRAAGTVLLLGRACRSDDGHGAAEGSQWPWSEIYRRTGRTATGALSNLKPDRTGDYRARQAGFRSFFFLFYLHLSLSVVSLRSRDLFARFPIDESPTRYGGEIETRLEIEEVEFLLSELNIWLFTIRVFAPTFITLLLVQYSQSDKWV